MRKTAIVTGCTRGIGNAIASALAKEGYAVAGIGSSPEEKVKEGLDRIRQYQEDFLYVRGSITDPLIRERLLNETLHRFGRLDLLVNNAGIAPPVRLDILETTEESFDTVMEINLKAAFFMTQICAKSMIEAVGKLPEYRPQIVNISSVSAYASSVNRGEYCISKAGLSMVTLLFADRLAEYGINVYEIRPGIIQTDMTSKVKEKYDKLIAEGITPIKRWGTPEDIADAVLVIASGKLGFVTGQVINVDGGFHIRRL
ncbi:MAG: 3-ketoacyl-ACP reductase [Clostridia bacterium]|jgi:3-oxoacyl-[acyl-carrier protein] reductase|nr:3-ketoacyl-ACP reductase [Clostridiaceae bacterium]